MNDNRINGKIRMPLLQFAPAFLVGAFLIAAALHGFASSSPVAAQTDTTAPTVSSIAITSDPDEDIREDAPYDMWGIYYVRPSGIYGIGDDIEVTVNFNEDVTVSGAPSMYLYIGNTRKAAGYLKAEDSAVVFRYTVAEGDEDTDGVAVYHNSLTLNGGSIRDGAGNDADLSHDALGVQANHEVDGIRPTISLTFTKTASRGGPGKPHLAGDWILVLVNWYGPDRHLTTADPRVTEPPQLMLDFDGVQRVANWDMWNPNGTGPLFKYVVQEGDLDTDGVAIKANSISLNGGFIKDLAGNDAILTHAAVPVSPDLKVDAVLPTITSIAITSDPGEDDTYGIGDRIEITVTFSENVRVPISSGSNTTLTYRPRLELNIGGNARMADYHYYSGADVVFAYTVQAGDSDEDGISIGANKLYLDGGKILDPAGNNPISATQHHSSYLLDPVSHGAKAADPNHKVQWASSSFTLNGPAAVRYKENSVTWYDPEGKRVGQYYVNRADDDVTWSLSGSDGNLFSLTGGSASSGNSGRTLWFNSPPNYEDPVDADADNEYRFTIEATDGTSSSSLQVVVVVTNDWHDSDEVPVITGTPQVGEILTADVSRISAVEWAPEPLYNWIRTDGTTDTWIGAGFSTYTLTADDEGNRIKVWVRYAGVSRPSEATAVVTAARQQRQQTNSPATGAPTISGPPRAGNTLRTDTSGISDDNGLDNAIFSHRWLADGADIPGATGSSYTLGDDDVGKTVKVRTSFTDDEGHEETLTSAPTDAVVASQPEVTGVAVSSRPASGDTYALGETVRIRVTFSEAMAVTGSPRLKIDMDPADWGTKWAAYESGSGASDLIFAHRVVEPNFSIQGIAVLENTLELNGGAINSTATQSDAGLSHTGLEHDPSHKVDWQANRAPVFHGAAQVLDNALPGFLVSLPVRQSDFSDPDGDPLTFELSASRDDVYASDGDGPGILHNERVGRIFFLAKTACGLASLAPPQDDAYYTVITMTATDPDGATAHATATFRTDPAGFTCPSLSSATADGTALTLTFDADLAPSFTEPAAHEFVVKADSVAVSVAEVSLGDANAGSDTGNTISLTLASPVSAGQTVTVSYASGDSAVVAAFADRTATNDTPAAQDGYEPNQDLIEDLWDYAEETEHGYDHVLRWMRVLKTLGAVADMTAAQAQDNANQFLAERWDPVVEELEKLENAPGDYEPDQDVVADVRGYARETQHGFDHVLRWMRVLKTFGDIADMTSSEAQGYADRGWERWDPVVEELREKEASTS